MAEETVWRGSSSQLKNLGTFSWCGVLAVVVIVIHIFAYQSERLHKIAPFVLIALLLPIFVAARAYLRTKCKVYQLTTERLKTTQGIFSKVTDTLELYRVKDLETRQPFSSRMCGLENVCLNTSDVNTPFVMIDSIPCSLGLADKIRNNVETIRTQKQVREIDVE